MTSVEAAQEIIKHDGVCSGVSCYDDDCPCLENCNRMHPEKTDRESTDSCMKFLFDKGLPCPMSPSNAEAFKENRDAFLAIKAEGASEYNGELVVSPDVEEALRKGDVSFTKATVLSCVPDPTTKYNHPVTGIDGIKTTIDIYRVLVAFNIVDPELQHSIKKLLNLGTRGKGDYAQDLDEAILSLQKMKQRKEQEA